MKQEAHKPNRNSINVLVDCTIFAAFLIVMAPHSTGISIHEWLGIEFGAAIMTHLLLHWEWLVAVTKRFFGNVHWSARINYVLNTLLFIGMTTALFTGIMISEQALPSMGIQLGHSGVWRQLHTLSANSTVLLIGFHVALHWSWIVSMLKRLIRLPRKTLSMQKQPQEGVL